MIECQANGKRRTGIATGSRAGALKTTIAGATITDAGITIVDHELGPALDVRRVFIRA